MNIEVVVASKTKESVYDAPGIITVISKKEINSFAETNLGEILNRVVSTSFFQLIFYKIIWLISEHNLYTI